MKLEMTPFGVTDLVWHYGRAALVCNKTFSSILKVKPNRSHYSVSVLKRVGLDSG